MRFFLISLIISVISHFLIMVILTIDFPLTKDSFKPHYIFLGPILTKNDFENFSTKNTQKISTIYSADLLPEITIPPQKTISEIEVPKPNYASSQTPKLTMKTTFTMERQTTEKPDIKEQSGEELPNPPSEYKPLRLRNL